MATYGIEIEFQSIRCAKSLGGADVFGKSHRLFEVRSRQDNDTTRLLYDVVTDMPKPDGSCLIECVSSVYEGQGDADAVFEPLDHFLRWLFDREYEYDWSGKKWTYIDKNTPAQTNAKNSFIIVPLTTLEGFYISWPYHSKKFVGSKRVPPENLPINAQASFGFNQNSLCENPASGIYLNTTVLQRFCQRYENIFLLGLHRNLRTVAGMRRVDFFMPDYHPFSVASKELYNAMLEGHCDPTDSTVLGCWPIFELLRYYIGFSLMSRDKDQVVNSGYKCYLNALVRGSFSYNNISSLFDHDMSQVGGIKVNTIQQYIRRTFHPAVYNNGMPFATIYPNGMITSNGQNGVVDETIAKELCSLRAADFIASTMVVGRLESRERMAGVLEQPDVVNRLCQNLQLNKKLSVALSRSLIQQIKTTINSRDYFSPVPYSLPTNSMGFYSRGIYDMYTGGEQNPPKVPRFFLEVRNFRPAVRSLCIQRFNEDPALLHYTTNVKACIIQLLNECREGYNHEGWYVEPLPPIKNTYS